MDYLATTWKKVQELGKAEGMVLNYHVLQTNNARAGEPDLILITEYKDYYSTAQQEAMQKKVNALLAQDNAKKGSVILSHNMHDLTSAAKPTQFSYF